MIIYLILAMGFLLCFVMTRKTKVPEEIKPKSPFHYFAPMGYFIYLKMEKQKDKWKNKRKVSTYIDHELKISNQLATLAPGRDRTIEHARYYLEKICFSLLIIVAGIGLAALMTYSSSKNGIIHDGVIERKGYEKGDTKTSVQVENEDGQVEEITLVVSNQDYTEEQMIAFYEDCIPKLESLIVNQNESLSYVTEDLYFPKKLDGYPFKISWHSRNYQVIKNNGEVDTSSLTEEGVVVMLEATLSYGTYEYIYEFGCAVYPKPLTEQEKYQKELMEALNQANEDTLTEEEYHLPEYVGGKKVTFQEIITDYGPKILILFLGIGILIYFMKDKDLSKKIEERKDEMMIDYPEIVSKITLLVGAGMTVRAAWKRIVIEYCKSVTESGRKRYAYEEMLLTMREIEAGISEVQAYDKFGKRSGLQQYVKFTTLISQNLRKGSAGFVAALEKEAQDALQERRTNARIKGEKAGTKLLMPMMMMLVIVLVMIMIPAFKSFG